MIESVLPEEESLASDSTKIQIEYVDEKMEDILTS